jgi:hypothetical protein
MTADRYLRQGTAVPVIYPGTVRYLSQAMKDALSASRRVPGPHLISVVRNGERYLIQEYENGTCTWIRQREDPQEM